jgi:hypothetical protein
MPRIRATAVTWRSQGQNCHVTDLKRDSRQRWRAGARWRDARYVLSKAGKATYHEFNSAHKDHVPSGDRMAVVSWLEWVRSMGRVEPPSAVDVGDSERQPITGAIAWVAKGQPQTRWDSDLRIGLPTCASLQPPAKSQIPSWCPVSLPCCPRNLLPPSLNAPLLSLRVAPTAVPPLHAPLYQHTTTIAHLNSRVDGHIVILDAAHTTAPAAAS